MDAETNINTKNAFLKLCFAIALHFFIQIVNLTAVAGDVVLVPLAQLPGARCRVHSPAR